MGRYCWATTTRRHSLFDHLRNRIFLLCSGARVIVCAALLRSWSETETFCVSKVGRSCWLVDACIYGQSHAKSPTDPKIIMIRIRILVNNHRLVRQYHVNNHRLARQYHNQAPSQRFNILYFGRDEFSCQVFEKLYTATGSTFSPPHNPH